MDKNGVPVGNGTMSLWLLLERTDNDDTKWETAAARNPKKYRSAGDFNKSVPVVQNDRMAASISAR